ncbi:response regulator transcription factor [Altererythrobacter lutimaris]|uniref:Response regulator transcription factor n=1 Tax=Altererythrobacter lutimaris TaxID=2743979 RepID=A0A850HJ32_9SPHN|nr:response regulator [Altererythrobacter lutimaris]NVE96002.1 response regulator transcription factor [Altererythrobacter lutimaris]
MANSEYPIYLVDDDDSVRRSVGFMLKTSGHKVESYVSGTEFLKEARSLEPGCVLLDIQMPEIDGLEVQTELRERGVPFPVVVMTGHGDVDVAVKAMKAGALDFIEKPFAKETMLGAVAEAFDKLDRSEAKSKRKAEAELLVNGLTRREREVLVGLTKGHPNKTIGYDLDISPRTVEIHRANLMKKLDVYNLSDLLRIAFAAGVGEEEVPQSDIASPDQPRTA